MKLTKVIATTMLSGALSLSAAGMALADSGTISGPTGPHSNNEVKIVNDNQVTTSNNTQVSLTNVNVQQTSTGSVTAKDNTTVAGPVTSGSATNSNTTATTVNVDNTGTGGSGGGLGSGSGGGSVSSGGSGGGSGGGSVLGASTTGGLGGGSGSVATLPDTGASSPVDVSAIRALYHAPQTTAPVAVAKASGGISAALLIGASLLSLTGAIGSTIYARRRERALA